MMEERTFKYPSSSKKPIMLGVGVGCKLPLFGKASGGAAGTIIWVLDIVKFASF
jgi:hypothetical protein